MSEEDLLPTLRSEGSEMSEGNERVKGLKKAKKELGIRGI